MQKDDVAKTLKPKLLRTSEHISERFPKNQPLYYYGWGQRESYYFLSQIYHNKGQFTAGI